METDHDMYEEVQRHMTDGKPKQKGGTTNPKVPDVVLAMRELAPGLSALGDAVGRLGSANAGAGAASGSAASGGATGGGAVAGTGPGADVRPAVAVLKGRCTVALDNRPTVVVRVARPASTAEVLAAVTSKLGAVKGLTYMFGEDELALEDSDNAMDLEELWAGGRTVAIKAVVA